MFIIFGNKSGGTEDLGAAAPVPCPNCHNEAFWHLVKVTSKATLFFVPVLTYGTKYYLACEVCNNAFEIGDEKVLYAKALIPVTEAFRRNQISKEEYVEHLQASPLLSSTPA